MEIWPTIEIRDGMCVRLSLGDLGDTRRQIVYGRDAADMATRWEAEGADGIHLVDLDGARSGERKNFDMIERIAEQADIPIQVGGGIRDNTAIEQFLEIGIKRIVIGTRAVSDPSWFTEMINQYPHNLLVGLDSRGGFATTHGRKNVTGTTVLGFAQQFASLPIAGIVYSDVLRGGSLSGPSFDAIQEMRLGIDGKLVAAGGIATTSHIERLAAMGIEECIIGSALYENNLSLRQAKHAAQAGVQIGLETSHLASIEMNQSTP